MKLRVENLTGGYNNKVVIDNVSIKIPEGKITTILGANGCGKSTLLKMIGRLLKISSGNVYFDDKSIKDISSANLAKFMAILPQQHNASGDITVEELISYGRYPHRNLNAVSLNDNDKKIINSAIKLTRLDEFRNKVVKNLSGGEKQRAWIAMTLAQEPKILLLDEPTTFLDICCQYEIIELIRRLNLEKKITVIMVLHDINLASRYSDYIITIKDKKIQNFGSPKDIITKENLKNIFNIESKIIYDTEDEYPFFIPIRSLNEIIKE